MLVKVIVYLPSISILELSLWACKDAKISIYPQARLFLSTASQPHALESYFNFLTGEGNTTTYIMR